MASIASLILCLASLSYVHWRSGLWRTGNSILGLVQLRGRSLVAKPPARISAFKWFSPFLEGKLISRLINKTISRNRGAGVALKVLLSEMSWVEAKEYFSKNDTVILPIGSTEPHGTHTPLGIDFLIAKAVAEETTKSSSVA